MATLTFPYSKNNIYVEAYTPEERAVIKTKTINLYEEYSNVKTLIDNISSTTYGITFNIYFEPVSPNSDIYIKIEGATPHAFTSGDTPMIGIRESTIANQGTMLTSMYISALDLTNESRPLITLPEDWVVTEVTASSK